MDEKEWLDFILPLENSFDNLISDERNAVEFLKPIIIEAIKKNCTGKFALSFSGGVDSTLIAFVAKKLGFNFRCYAVGLENSQDVFFARKIAQELGLDLRAEVLSIDELENIIESVVNIIREPDVTKVSVGSVGYAIFEMAKEDSVERILTGLGSEEIFAGYDRHLKSLGENNSKDNWKALHEECWNGLKGMWQRDLSRDFAIAKTFGIEIGAPFLDKDVIISSMNIHPKLKLDSEHKKIILRKTAESLGLPKEFAWRGKKAAQYGSKFILGLDKLSRRNGFKMKKGYLSLILDKIPQ